MTQVAPMQRRRPPTQADLGHSAGYADEAPLLRWLRAQRPRQLSLLGETTQRLLAREALTRAGAYGLFTVQEQGLFLSLMLKLGAHFDSDPCVPWAAAALMDHSRAPRQRAQQADALAHQHLTQVLGPGGRYAHRAAARLCFGMPAFLGQGREAGDPELLDYLAWLHPQRFDRVGQPATEAMIALGRPLAADNGLDTPADLSMGLASMFLLGVGFHVDPQYAGLTHLLTADHDTQCPGTGLERFMLQGLWQ